MRLRKRRQYVELHLVHQRRAQHGSGVTQTQGGGVLIVLGGLNVPHSIYGRIPQQQNVPTGNNGDTITVTLNYN
jgi:spore coat protein U-like protein